MIIIGYPGIGKSTLVKQNRQIDGHGFIDLESSHFSHFNATEKWYIQYCNVAISLHEQGFYVFVSSHKEVIKNLMERVPEECMFVYPDIKLKDEWIEKLRERWINSADPAEETKNKRAYDRVNKHFDEDIQELMLRSKYRDKVVLKCMDYNLYVELLLKLIKN